MSSRIELVGWKEIAAALDVTVRSAQRYATEGDDPLPCFRRKHSVRLAVAELARNRAPLRPTAAPPTEVIHADARVAPLLREIERAAVRVFSEIAASSGSKGTS